MLIEAVKLYHAPSTPSSRKVRMFLHEKGIEVPIVDVTDGFYLSSWYKGRYSHGIVPMLEFEDGIQLGEAIAICRYFEEIHPEPSLMGVDARDKAIVEMWERRAYLEGAAAVEEVFRNSHPLMANRGLPGTDEVVPQLPVLVERGKQSLRRFYIKFDGQLAKTRFIAGNRFSMADISTLCAIDFGRAFDLGPPNECKNIGRWYSEVSSRPSASA